MTTLITSLNQKVEGVAGGSDFKLAPNGDYILTITDIGEWKPKVYPTLDVIQYTDKLQQVKDADGKPVKVKHTNVTVYSTLVTLQIVEGEFAGTVIKEYISTHPNSPYTIRNFIKAFELDGYELSDFPTVGAFGLQGGAEIEIVTEEYEQTKTDEYGRETKVPKSFTKNKVKRFKPISDLRIG